MIADPFAAANDASRVLAQATAAGFAFVTSGGAWQPAAHFQVIDDALQRIAAGTLRRLIIQLPIRHGKSEMITGNFPAFYLGHNPDNGVMLGTYNQKYARRWGRFARNKLNRWGPAIFGVSVAGDSSAADEWSIADHRGGYFSTGVGAGSIGLGGNLMIIDDPFGTDQEAHSQARRGVVDEWYRGTFRTRLAPGGAIIVVMCMTGDTPVRAADGSERRLDAIRPGDLVATYENGNLSTSRVLAWKDQGEDDVFELVTVSGTRVRANRRHPFLVSRAGIVSWVKLGDIELGDGIARLSCKTEHPSSVRVSGAAIFSPRPVSMGTSSASAQISTASVQNMPEYATRTLGGGSGAESSAPQTGASPMRSARGSVRRITSRLGGLRDTALHRIPAIRAASLAFDTDTVSSQKSTTPCSWPKAESVPFANNRQRPRIRRRIGRIAFVSITTMKPMPCAGSFVIAATSCSRTHRMTRQSCGLEPNSWKREQAERRDFDFDEVVEIVPAGRAVVYDIQIERTENFIANGLVSHNSRWDDDDLVGRLLKREREDQPEITGDERSYAPEPWTVIDLPGIALNDGADGPKGEGTYHDALGRAEGEALWPKRWPVEALLSLKVEMGTPKFSANVQGRPLPATGGMFQAAWFRRYQWLPDERVGGWFILDDGKGTQLPLNQCLGFQVVDLAISEKEEADWFVITTFAYHRPSTNLFVRNVFRRHLDALAQIKALQMEFAVYKPEYVAIESVAYQSSVVTHAVAAGLPAVKLEPGKEDKVTRAIPAAARYEAGMIWHPYKRTGDWVDTLETELVRFPKAKKDQVDTVAYAALLTINEATRKHAAGAYVPRRG